MRRIISGCAVAFLLAASSPALAASDAVRVKDLGRFQAAPGSVLVGYGVVTGLAGSGDSPRNEVTQQALKNVLSRFGANITIDQVRSRNVAAVMVTGSLARDAKVGDRVDVAVSSIGDARSLLGGSLLMTPLLGADRRAYATAQGAVVVGGYRFDSDRNIEQKNHPTSGVVPGGAMVDSEMAAGPLSAGGPLLFVLANPDVTTAARVADTLNRALGPGRAHINDTKSVAINTEAGADPYRLISRVEELTVHPDLPARVVINERSGTVVAGGGVRISSVVISQGDVRISVIEENAASQPTIYGGVAPDLRSLVISNTKLSVSESSRDAAVSFPNTTIADLVEGLSQLHVRTREMIAIMQAMKAAGALHAEIVVQ